MSTFSVILLVIGIAIVVRILLRIGMSWSYATGYEKGRAESTVVVVSPRNSFNTVLMLIILALLIYNFVT